MSSEKQQAMAGAGTPNYVGFANLPNQVHRKSVKKGFEFTLMVIGESGLGKSTLINSLFLSDLYPDRVVPNAQGKNGVGPSATPNTNKFNENLMMRPGARNGHDDGQRFLEKYHQNVKINAKTVEIEEKGVKLRLTVIDCPGFGDAINNNQCFTSIIKYVDDQFEKYFHSERGVNRRNIADNRVHCCFYFISPFGHGLKPLDIEFMKQLHNKVNIVPIIGKADVLNKAEVVALKKKVIEEIKSHGIKVYTLPDCDEDEDEGYKEEVKKMKESMPFAVSGSNTFIEAKGRKIRGILFPWGVVEIENPEHSDFIKLRNMLITHMQDLQEVTQEVHYENYRLSKLAQEARSGVKMNESSSILEDKTNVSVQDKDDMARMLAEKEAELKRMQEIMQRMQMQAGNGK